MEKKGGFGSGKVGAQCPNPWNAKCRSLSTYGARSKITGFAADASQRDDNRYYDICFTTTIDVDAGGLDA